MFAGNVEPFLSVIEAWSRKLSFCPLLKINRDVILLSCDELDAIADIFVKSPATPPLAVASTTAWSENTSDTSNDFAPENGDATN